MDGSSAATCEISWWISRKFIATDRSCVGWVVEFREKLSHDDDVCWLCLKIKNQFMKMSRIVCGRRHKLFSLSLLSCVEGLRKIVSIFTHGYIVKWILNWQSDSKVWHSSACHSLNSLARSHSHCCCCLSLHSAQYILSSFKLSECFVLLVLKRDTLHIFPNLRWQLSGNLSVRREKKYVEINFNDLSSFLFSPP